MKHTAIRLISLVLAEIILLLSLPLISIAQTADISGSSGVPSDNNQEIDLQNMQIENDCNSSADTLIYPSVTDVKGKELAWTAFGNLSGMIDETMTGGSSVDHTAETEYESDSIGKNPYLFTYGLQVDNTISINGIKGECPESIIIPAFLDGLPVTSVSTGAFAGKKNLKSITLPDSITSVGTNAFYNTGFYNDASNWVNGVLYLGKCLIKADSNRVSGVFTVRNGTKCVAGEAFLDCVKLTKIILPDGIVTIGGYAFSGCKGLTSMIFPNSLTSIGRGALDRCSGLTELSIPFTGEQRLTPDDQYQYPLGYIFGALSFSGSVEVKQRYYYISTSTYYTDTFYIPEKLKKVTVTDSKYILYGAFYNCSNITEIILSDGVTSIENSAFEYCKKLSKISIPDSVTHIGTNALSSTAIINNQSDWDNGVLYLGSVLYRVSTKKSGVFTVKQGTAAIAPYAFYACKSITEVILPDGVTYVGDYSFQNCTVLNNINIPDGVTIIGQSAFSQCASLTDICIPGSVKTIGVYAFSGCTSLQNLSLSEGIESIRGSAFSGCTGLKSINIPDSVTTLSGSVFAGCSNLTELSIPYVLGHFGRYFGSEAYSGGVLTRPILEGTGTTNECYYIPSALKSVTISGSKIIPNYAFINCKNIRSVSILKSTEIGVCSFNNCTGLTNVSFPEDLTKINREAFSSCVKLTSVDLKDNLTIIGTDAFWGCTSLSDITLPEGVEYIGKNAFYATAYYNDQSNWVDRSLYLCGYLIASQNPDTVHIPEGTKLIASNAFRDCTNLENVIIPEGVETIGDSAFNGCKKLNSITLPSTLSVVGNDAFNNCSSLTSVSFNGTLTQWCGIDFSEGYSNPVGLSHSLTIGGESLNKLVIPDGITEIKQGTFLGCVSITEVTLPESITSLGPFAFSGCSGMKSINIPSAVKAIDGYCFYNCRALKSLDLPEGIESISSMALYNCSSLSSITIPDNAVLKSSLGLGYTAYYKSESNWENDMLYIGKHLVKVRSSFTGECSIKPDTKSIVPYAFSGCNGITEIFIPESVSSIGDYAFYNCSGLADISIPEKVSVLGANAFSGCTSLSSVNLTNNLVSIGEKAFEGCENISDVYYSGSVEDWLKITFSSFDSNPAYYAERLYIGDRLIDELTVPDTVTCIPDYAFNGYAGLTSVIVPETVTDISKTAFLNCANLKDVYYYESGVYQYVNAALLNNTTNYVTPHYSARRLRIRYIDIGGNTVFDPVEKLVSAGDEYSVESPELEYFIPDKETVSGIMPDSGLDVTVTYYENVMIGSGTCGDGLTWKLYESGDLVFNGSGDIPNYLSDGAPWHEYADKVLNIILPYGITAIGDNAFEDCVNAVSADLGYSLVRIGDCAFYGCTALRGVILPDTVSVIGDEAFCGCVSQASFAMPEALTSIGARAFCGCTALQKITLGVNIAVIGDSAFDNCADLKRIVFLGNPLTASGSRIFGDEADGPVVYYYSFVEGWNEALTDGMYYLGYEAFPIDVFNNPDPDNISDGSRYYIKVIDKNNLPLNNAEVILGSSSARTNKEGIAFLNKPVRRVQLEVSCSYHKTYTDSYYCASATQMMDIITLSDKPASVQGVRCGSDSIASSVSLINCSLTDMVDIVVAGDSKYAIVKYELRQGTRLIQEVMTDSKTCTFTVSQNSFEEGDSVFVRMYTADGSSVSSALNIDVAAIASVSTQQILDELNSIDLTASVGELGDISTPLNFGTEKSLIYVHTEGRNIRIGINLDIDKIIKQFAQSNSKSLESFIQKKIEEQLTSNKPGLSTKIKPYLCGYVDIVYLGKGRYYVKTCNVKLGVEMKVSFEAELLSVIGIINVYMKASLSADFALSLTITRFAPDSGFSVSDVTLPVKTKLDLEVGVDVLLRCCSASAYGNLTMGFDLMLYPRTYFKRVYITGEVGVKYSLLWGLLGEGTYPLAKGDIYDSSKRSRSMYSDLMTTAYSDPSGYVLHDRSYLDTRSEWQPILAQSARSGTDGDLYRTLQSNTYSDIAPRIVTAGDTTVMMWFDDSPEKDPYNFRTLYYAVYDEERQLWSDPVQLDSNDTLDCEFDLISDGEKIYVVYTELKNPLSGIDHLHIDNAEEVSAFVSGVELTFAVFENGAFSAPVTITDNDVCEIMPKLQVDNGTLTATWAVSDNLGLSDSGNKDGIYSSTFTNGAWSDPTPLITGSNLITAVDSGKIGSEYYTAYVVDADGNTTTDDMSLVITDHNYNASVVTSGAISEVSFETINGNNMLVWLCDGRLYSMSEAVSGNISPIETSAGFISSYRIVQMKDHALMTYVAQSNSGSDVYGVLIDADGKASEPTRLTDTDGYVGDYDIVCRSDGLMITFCENSYSLVYNDEPESVTDFRYMLYSFADDIELVSVDYDLDAVVPGESVEVSAQVRNNGLTAISGVDIKLIDDSDKVVFSDEADVSIEPGMTAQISFLLDIPMVLSGLEYTLQILPKGTAEKTSSDNQAKMQLSYYDLAVDMEQKYVNGKNQLLILISNLGNTAANASLRLLAGDENGRLIAEINAVSSKPDKPIQYAVELDGLITAEDEIVTCTVSGGEDERCLSNNSDAVKLFRVDVSGYSEAEKEAVENPQLSQSTVVFDRYTDYTVTVDIESGARQFAGVDGLTAGTDYEIQSGTVTFLNEFLRTLDSDRTLEFVFIFGEDDSVIRSFGIHVTDSAPTVINGELMILGNVVAGETVTACSDQVTPFDAELTYVWTLDDTVISTDADCTIPMDAADKTLTLSAEGTNGYTGALTYSALVRLKSCDIPYTPICRSVTATSISIVPVIGVEYSLDGSTWQLEPEFTGLLPEHTYTVYARYAADEFTGASEMSSLSVTTIKGKGEKAPAPCVAAIDDTYIELEATDGYEYRMSDGEWQASPLFTNLEPDTEYTFYQRAAETALTYAGEESDGLQVRTLKYFSISGRINATGNPDDEVTVRLSEDGEIIAEYSGALTEYRFDRLMPNTLYMVSYEKKNCINGGLVFYVENSDYEYDISIFLLGDVNRDGVISIGDYSKTLAIVRDTVSVSVSERLLADVDDDGTVTEDDCQAILDHIKGIKSLW